MNEKPISIVSLGPGDPELLTLGALHDLQRADVIFCPTTGPADADAGTSRAGRLLLASGIARERIRLFELGMRGDRRGALETYDAVARAAVEASSEGLEVAVAAEGDAGIFASVHYIGDRIAALGRAVRYRAGIPAFIAAGALAGLHLIKQRESLIVVPELRDAAHAEALGCKRYDGGHHEVVAKRRLGARPPCRPPRSRLALLRKPRLTPRMPPLCA